MKKYNVHANGHSFGIYEAENEQAARDACAKDAGYQSEADMVEWLYTWSQPPSNLVAVEEIEAE